MRKFRFLEVVAATLLLGITIAAPLAEARGTTYTLDIPSQNLNDALQALALASRHKLLYSSELVDGKSSPALKGDYTTEQAVRYLLSGTNLTYEITADELVLIYPPNPAAGPTAGEIGAGSKNIRLALGDDDQPATPSSIPQDQTAPSGANPDSNES